MDVSISHIAVRVHPALEVQVSTLIDGEPARAVLDRDAIEHLVGSALGDEHAMRLRLQREAAMLRVAAAAYVAARGLPLERQFVLSRADFTPAIRQLGAASEAAE